MGGLAERGSDADLPHGADAWFLYRSWLLQFWFCNSSDTDY
jgi:hypothetical protein